MIKNKLDLDKLINVINYRDVEKDYLYENDEGTFEFNFEECFEKGMNEDDFPETFKDFKKYGRPLSEIAVWAYDSDDINAAYFFNDNSKSITICSDNFTMKECITIINIINEHIKNVGAGQFISYGRNDNNKHKLWHEESTAFGYWWNDFIKFYQNNLKKKKISTIEIYTTDYETDDERYYTKDRVIKILFY